MGFFRAAFIAFLLNLIISSAEDKLTLSPGKNEYVKSVGDTFYVTCKAKGRNVQRVMWTGPEKKQITNYSSNPDQQSKKSRIHIDAGPPDQPGLELYNLGVEMKDRGNYTCSANIDGREVEKSFELKVYKAADFKGTQVEQFLEEGTNSTLQCNVSGDPPPKITWLKGRKQIRPRSQKKFKVHPDNKDWLIIYNVTLDDAANYTCRTVQLSDSISELRKFQIAVHVNHKPFSPNAQVRESFSFITGMVNLTCEAVAQPEAKFTWIKDGVTVNTSDIYEIFDESHKSVLQINVEDEQMFGDYNCKAQNNLGTFERVLTLEKGKQPAIPHTEIKNTGKNQVTLKIHSQNQPEMPILAYQVEYKQPGEPWNEARKQEFKSGYPYILKGLRPNTAYVIRASAQNVAGLSDPSPEIIRTTLNMSTSSAITTTATFSMSFLISLAGILAERAWK